MNVLEMSTRLYLRLCFVFVPVTKTNGTFLLHHNSYVSLSISQWMTMFLREFFGSCEHAVQHEQSFETRLKRWKNIAKCWVSSQIRWSMILALFFPHSSETGRNPGTYVTYLLCLFQSHPKSHWNMHLINLDKSIVCSWVPMHWELHTVISLILSGVITTLIYTCSAQ